MSTIKKGTRFQKTYRGMSVTSRDSEVVETWEVVECLDNAFECKLISSNAVMEVNQDYTKFFTANQIQNSNL